MPIRRTFFTAALPVIAAASTLPVPARACDTGPFRIYFHPGSARLSDQDKQTLDSMKLMAQADGFIRLSAHTDTAGAAEANQLLARRRAEGARAFLVSLGMPVGRIITESFGESRSITALDDSSPSWRHRYVLVELLSPAQARKGRSGRAKRSCGDG
ncbi:MAG TPA: OmpA family protein [Allosphingosinicella sp.]|jgi:outer membrane protein OmpA-like peptidoglycan-associated protein